MANEIIAVTYTSDRGVDFVTGMNREVFTQQNAAATAPLVGGSAAAANSTDPPLPSSVIPRRALVANASGKLRTVVLLTKTASLGVGADQAITLEDSDGVSSSYTYQKTLAENFGKQRRKQ